MEANRIEFTFIKEISSHQVEYLLAAAITAAEALTPIENYDGKPVVKFNRGSRRGVFDVTTQVGQDAATIFRRYAELNFSRCAYRFVPKHDATPEPMTPGPGEERLGPGE
jgi:hypothetical protein